MFLGSETVFLQLGQTGMSRLDGDAVVFEFLQDLMIPCPIAAEFIDVFLVLYVPCTIDLLLFGNVRSGCFGYLWRLSLVCQYSIENGSKECDEHEEECEVLCSQSVFVKEDDKQ